MNKPNTVRLAVRKLGCKTPCFLTKAGCDADGTIRIYDDIAGHWVPAMSITPNQERYVRSRVIWGGYLKD